MTGMLQLFEDDLDPRAVQIVLEVMRRKGYMEVVGYTETGEPRYVMTDAGVRYVEEEIYPRLGVSHAEAMAYVDERCGDHPRRTPPGITAKTIATLGSAAR